MGMYPGKFVITPDIQNSSSLSASLPSNVTVQKTPAK
jgi:hypothetical protein